MDLFESLIGSKIIPSGGGGGGAALNIAYGQEAPSDTSKIWIKADGPESLDIKFNNGTPISPLWQLYNNRSTSLNFCVSNEFLYFTTNNTYNYTLYRLSKDGTITTVGNFNVSNYCTAMIYDNKRDVIYVMYHYSGVNLVTLNPKTAEVLSNRRVYGSFDDVVGIHIYNDTLYHLMYNGRCVVIRLDDMSSTATNTISDSDYVLQSNYPCRISYIRDGYLCYVSTYKISKAKIFKLNLQTNMWESAPPSISFDSNSELSGKTNYSNYASCYDEVNNRVWLFGGEVDNNHRGSGCKKIHYLDLSDNTIKTTQITLSDWAYFLYNGWAISFNNKIFVGGFNYYNGRGCDYSGMFTLELNSQLQEGQSTLYLLSGSGIPKAYLLNSSGIKQEVNSCKYFYGDANNKATPAPVYYHNGTDWIQFT